MTDLRARLADALRKRWWEKRDPSYPTARTFSRMGGIRTGIAGALFKLLWDKLEPLIVAKFEELAPTLVAALVAKFEEWMPKVVKATVVAVAQSAGQLVVDTENKVTDIIPGHLDDKVLDPIVQNVFDVLHRLGG